METFLGICTYSILYKTVMECYATNYEGSDFYFFAALNCSCLGFNDLLALLTKEGGNRGIKSKKGAIMNLFHRS